ncbi:hypothetical protein GCM10009430_06690 [Aquimarina litoralis]|uniref:Uncharacterized protein n=1 Tax=Aquimarina litoralis TaxID=584605 RepID=A0ABN1IHX1_9FLAO
MRFFLEIHTANQIYDCLKGFQTFFRNINLSDLIDYFRKKCIEIKTYFMIIAVNLGKIVKKSKN